MNSRFHIGYLGSVLGVAALCAGSLAAQTTINQFPLGADVQPLEIAAGPDGNLWFVVNGDGTPGTSKIGRITTGGAITEFVLPDTSRPVGIVAGPDGAMWFTESGTPAIGRVETATFPAAPSVTRFTAGISITAAPFGISTGPDGNLWFAERNNNAIGRITPSGVVTEFPIGFPAALPLCIVAGPDGNLWFSDRGVGSSIGVMTVGGSMVKRIATPTANGEPSGITVGPDGRIWFVEYRSSMIGVLPTSATLPADITEFASPTLVPYRIVSGPDGALWFTENNNGAGGKIGRITTAGTIVEYTAPGLAGPYGIAVGPDRALWFTEPDNVPAKIGQLVVDCVGAVPSITGGGSVCSGTPLSLSASAGWTSYQWFRNGVAIPGATSATWTKTAATGDTGSYTVTGTTGTCASNPSAPALVTVVVQQTATAGSSQSICSLRSSRPLGGNTPTDGVGAWSVVSGGTGTFSPDASEPNAIFTHTGGAGPIVLAWTITNPPCAESAAGVTLTIGASQTVPIAAPSSVCAGSRTSASVPDGGPGTTYTWSVSNGTLVSGQGTPGIVFNAGPSGTATIDVVQVDPTCTSTATAAVSIDPGCAGPMGFVPVAPCRRIDTRLPADSPRLAAGEQRTFVLVNGPCTIPSSARAVSVNLTVTQGSAFGDLKVFATGTAVPTATTINFGANRTRANNAMLALSSDGTGRVDVKNDAAGSVHVIVDVNGYYR